MTRLIKQPAFAYFPGVPAVEATPARPATRNCPGGGGSSNPGGGGPPPGDEGEDGTPPDPPVQPCNTYCVERDEEGNCTDTRTTC